MKTSLYIASLVVWVGLLLSFTYCSREDDKERKDSTNSERREDPASKRRQWRLPSDGEPNNVYPPSKKRDRDTTRNERTNSSNDGIDFNSTRNRDNSTTATNGTRPGSTGINNVRPRPEPAPRNEPSK
jgi:hypothetical protein